MDYYKNKVYEIDNLWFSCNGESHCGKGKLFWNYENGFKIEAKILKNERKSNTYGIPRLGLLPRCTIKMKIAGYRYVIAPNTPIYDFLRIKTDSMLEQTLERVIFIANNETCLNNSVKCNLKCHDNHFYPFYVEGVNSNSHIYIPAGTFIENEAQIIETSLIDNKSVTMQSQYKKVNQSNIWFWPEASKLALSILLGDKVILYQKEYYKNNTKYTEIRKQKVTGDLSYLTLLDNPFNKAVFVGLTDLFMNEPEVYNICVNVFEQVYAATRQENRQARELLISTILEGILRTEGKHPFRLDDKTWDFKNSWETFKTKYFKGNDKLWEPIFEKIKTTREVLRHRNAHPDWLWKDNGYYSQQQIEQSTDDMIFLCRFYGYIILAMAGYNDLKPNFPLPYKEWPAAISYNRQN